MKSWVADFNRDGFVILNGFLSKTELTNIHLDIKRVFLVGLSHSGFKETPLSINDSFEKLYQTVMKKDPGLKSKAYDLLGRLNSVTQVFGKELLTELAAQIIKEPIILNSVQVRLDDNANNFILPWHQETNQISILTINLWMPLVNIDDKMGGLEVCPGSHLFGLRKHLEKSDDRQFESIPESVIKDHKKVRIQVKAGDALVFHPFLYHRSIPNTGSKIRLTVAGRLNELETSAYLRSQDSPLLIPRNPDKEKPQYKFIEKFLSEDFKC